MEPRFASYQTANEFETWVNTVVDGEQSVTLVWDGAELLGGGYEFERIQTATLQDAADGVQTVSWSERVQVFHSLTLAQSKLATLEKHLMAATDALRTLTPVPGRGKHPIRDEATLQAAINAVLARYDVEGLLTVRWERHETTVTRCFGRGRRGPQRPTYTRTQVHYLISEVQRNEEAISARRHRFGWHVQVTNAAVDQLSLAEAVLHYRGGWVLERDFHLVKDLPLGLSPLFVWKDDQIKGLVRLLTLALRLLTLIEFQVRQELAKEQTTMNGLYEGQANRATARPTAKRILRAFAKAQITLTRIETNRRTEWHLTPLESLHEQILRYLRLPVSLYTALIQNSS